MSDNDHTLHMPVEEDKTEQAHAIGTDPNDIVRRHLRGEAIPMNAQRPRYGDFSEGSDFDQVMIRVREAELQFSELPAYVRDLCENQISIFLEKSATPDGLAALVKAGMHPTQAPADEGDPCPPSPASSKSEQEAKADTEGVSGQNPT